MTAALVPVPQSGVLPSPADWRTMLDMAGALVASGLLPAHIKTREAAVAIMQKGAELGIAPMYAMSNIVVINGKPTANSELMLAIIYRDHGDDAIHITETTAKSCTISYKRRAWAHRQVYTFTIEEARAANLIKAGPWSTYPAAMLRARCISAVARMAFPDSIGGMYTADELGATVQVSEDGEVSLLDAAPIRRVDTTTGEVLDTPPPIDLDILRALALDTATALHNRGVPDPEFPADDATPEDILRIVNAHIAANVAAVDTDTSDQPITVSPGSKLGKRLHNLVSVHGIRLTVPTLTPRSASWLLAMLAPAPDSGV